MENNEFDAILDAIRTHLKREKIFIQNPERMAHFSQAMSIAETLFPDHKREIKDDPLQTGALILAIECTDTDTSISLSSIREIDAFSEMLLMADNFEIYIHNGNIRLAMVFNGVYKLIN